MEMISGIPFGANLAKSFRTDRTSSRASQHGGSANVMRLVRASAGLITLSPNESRNCYADYLMLETLLLRRRFQRFCSTGIGSPGGYHPGRSTIPDRRLESSIRSRIHLC